MFGSSFPLAVIFRCKLIVVSIVVFREYTFSLDFPCTHRLKLKLPKGTILKTSFHYQSLAQYIQDSLFHDPHSKFLLFFKPLDIKINERQSYIENYDIQLDYLHYPMHLLCAWTRSACFVIIRPTTNQSYRSLALGTLRIRFREPCMPRDDRAYTITILPFPSSAALGIVTLLAATDIGVTAIESHQLSVSLGSNGCHTLGLTSTDCFSRRCHCSGCGLSCSAN
jgi:hypothetical protein